LPNKIKILYYNAHCPKQSRTAASQGWHCRWHR